MVTRKIYNGLIKELKDNEIMVFGSNPEGRHGAGVAKLAHKKYGAKWGKGRGLEGKTYGLVTTNLTELYFEEGKGIMYYGVGAKSLTPKQITENIKEFYDFAEKNKFLEFLVAYTDNGYNLNGYTSRELAKMFSSYDIPSNVVFHDGFSKLL